MEPQTLEGAKQWLRDRVDDGARCPCCTQFAKVYRRNLNATMAAGLIVLYRMTKPDFGYLHVRELIPRISSFASGGGEFAKLVYWHFIEEKIKSEDDDKRTSGWWRITDHGVAFVERRILARQRVCIYDSRNLKFDGSEVSIDVCLKKKFSYLELMNGGT